MSQIIHQHHLQDRPNLILKMGMGIGDLVFLEPAIRYALTHYVNEIHLFSRSDGMEMYKDYPYVTAYDINSTQTYLELARKLSCPIIEINIAISRKPSESRWMAFARYVIESLGYEFNKKFVQPPQFWITKEEQEWGKQYVNAQPNQLTVLIQCTSSRKYKNFKPAFTNQLIKKFLDAGYRVIAISSSSVMRDKNVKWVRGLSIRQLMCVISAVDYALTLDSAPAWIASALNIPTTVCFGATDARQYATGMNNVIAIQSPYNKMCLPCGWVGCDRVTCMDSFDVDDLYDCTLRIKQPESLQQYRISPLWHKVAVIRKGGLGDAIAVDAFLCEQMIKRGLVVDYYVDDYMVDMFHGFGKHYTKPISSYKDQQYDGIVNLTQYMEQQDPDNTMVRPEVIGDILPDNDYEFSEWRLDGESLRAGRKILEQHGYKSDAFISDNLIGIQVTSASPIRVYPPDLLRQLIDLLVSKGYEVVLVGEDKWNQGYGNWIIDRVINLVGRTTLVEVAGVMANCNYFIAPDSGFLHLAGVMGIRTLGLFGNIYPDQRIKYYPDTIAMFPIGELSCIPCGDQFNPCPECADMESRGDLGGKCIRLLEPNRVVAFFMNHVTLSSPSMLHCPLCNGVGELINEIRGQWFSEYYDHVPYWQCQSCHTIYSDRDMETVSYEKDYWTVEGQFSGDYFTRAGQERQRAVLDRLLLYLVNSKSVLEVGCGPCGVLELLKAQGYDVAGVDISQWAVAHGKQKGIDVHVGSIEHIPFDDQYDAVLCIDTIEHSKSPVQAYREMRRVLRPNGIMVIGTPNAEGEWIKDLSHFLWSPCQHYSMLSLTALTKLAHQHGDSIMVTTEGHNLWAVIAKGSR